MLVTPYFENQISNCLNLISSVLTIKLFASDESVWHSLAFFLPLSAGLNFKCHASTGVFPDLQIRSIQTNADKFYMSIEIVFS